MIAMINRISSALLIFATTPSISHSFIFRFFPFFIMITAYVAINYGVIYATVTGGNYRFASVNISHLADGKVDGNFRNLMSRWVQRPWRFSVENRKTLDEM